MIVKMIKYFEKKMEEMQVSINKDLEELMNKHTETSNTITETKKAEPWSSLYNPGFCLLFFLMLP